MPASPPRAGAASCSPRRSCEPALADRDVNRHVQLRLAEIEQAQANSAQAASIAFRSAVFDADEPGLPDERR